MDALYGPPLPRGCEHLWKWFRLLSAARGPGNGFGEPGGVGMVEIEAFARLRGIDDMTEWEIEALLALEQAFRRFSASQTKDKRKSKEAE